MEALSGIDVALWDLKGKILDRPVYQLLGGAQRQKIWAYASSLRFRGIETTVTEAKEFVARGYDAMKLKIGKNPFRYEADLELATAVRQAVGPDVFLSADANCGMERTAAIKLARGLEKLDFAWFEEPLAPDDLDGYAEMARVLDMPIAGGETEFSRFGFREILNRKAMDIIRPNVTRCGGFTECMRCDGRGVPCPICTAHWKRDRGLYGRRAASCCSAYEFSHLRAHAERLVEDIQQSAAHRDRQAVG